mmetsp:Transcript_30731/g.89183  ORF Transcript_30731/g.89183 Transcript_30731/m.89183 type:complete len:201 (-) Transcript_30731:620-1222(-)
MPPPLVQQRCRCCAAFARFPLLDELPQLLPGQLPGQLARAAAGARLLSGGVSSAHRLVAHGLDVLDPGHHERARVLEAVQGAPVHDALLDLRRLRAERPGRAHVDLILLDENLHIVRDAGVAAVAERRGVPCAAVAADGLEAVLPRIAEAAHEGGAGVLALGEGAAVDDVGLDVGRLLQEDRLRGLVQPVVLREVLRLIP